MIKVFLGGENLFVRFEFEITKSFSVVFVLDFFLGSNSGKSNELGWKVGKGGDNVSEIPDSSIRVESNTESFAHFTSLGDILSYIDFS